MYMDVKKNTRDVCPKLGKAAAMVIDPDPSVLESIGQTLAELGFRVLTARSVDEGKRLAAARGPLDLVVADLTLQDHLSSHLGQSPGPDFSGRPVLLASREREPGPAASGQPPFLFLETPVPATRLATLVHSLIKT